MQRVLVVVMLALAVSVGAASSAVRVTPIPVAATVAPGAPSGLRAFELSTAEPIAHSYPRTPSFAWNPAPETGGFYQFELATSQTFADGTVVYRNNRVSMPETTVPLQLPWMSGNPYALWARVRWTTTNTLKATRWSQPFGFNMRWLGSEVPQSEPAPEGLVRWKPIAGATAYEVLYPDLIPSVSFETTTNVADEREFFTFHNALGYGTIHWRVRAIRQVGTGEGPLNGLPAVSYGPWSPVFTVHNKPLVDGKLRPTSTVSDVWTKAGQAGAAHQLTPGFAWNPSAPDISEGIDPGSSLYRVYIFTDPDCVNRVFTGSIVGSPAFAPRTIGGPMPLPTGLQQLQEAQDAPPFLTGAGSEGDAVDATGAPVVSNETPGAEVGSGQATATSSTGSGSTEAAGVDLWDSGWPSGRYYWTVVPVSIQYSTYPQATTTTTAGSTTTTGATTTAGTTTTGTTGSGTTTTGSTTTGSTTSGTTTSATTTAAATTTTSSSSSSSGTTTAATSGSSLAYHDMALPQDQCEAGDVMSFGKVSQPVVASAGKPFLSGVGETGRNVVAVSSDSGVFAFPVAAWEPTYGASSYEVQISQSGYPWHTDKTIFTESTSIVLPLTKFDVGTWYYRVRSIDASLPVGAQRGTWSNPVRVIITGNRVAVVG